MKKITPILTICLFLILFYFCSCDKAANDRDRQKIEEYKNSPRDSRVIGKWKLVNMNLENVQLAVHFRLDGVVETGLPVFNKNNEIAFFKRDNTEEYFYTINDSTIRSYVIKHHLLHGSYSITEHYKIMHEDTIHIYNSNSQSIGIRDNDIEIRN